MEEKYYTPDIEDLRIGYECEKLTRNIGEFDKEVCQDWFRCKIGQLINPNPELLRTPYLTKEQIEKEGFIWKRTYDRETTYNNKYPTKMEFELNNVYKIGGAFLTYISENNYIEINTIDEGYNADGPNNSIKFKGMCKSINEFRTICKWLKI